MRGLERRVFDPEVCRTELAELRALLRSRPYLAERQHILPFFKARCNLSMLIGGYVLNIGSADALTHEYPLCEHFRADLIVGNTAKHDYLLVEFEDAAPDGLFVKRARSVLEWSPRYEHAFSQVVDWLWTLEDQRSTGDFESVFGSRRARFHGLIVVGKDVHLESREMDRLRWRTDKVMVDSQRVSCVTFDELADDLDFRLMTYYGK